MQTPLNRTLSTWICICAHRDIILGRHSLNSWGGPDNLPHTQSQVLNLFGKLQAYNFYIHWQVMSLNGLPDVNSMCQQLKEQN